MSILPSVMVYSGTFRGLPTLTWDRRITHRGLRPITYTIIINVPDVGDRMSSQGRYWGEAAPSWVLGRRIISLVAGGFVAGGSVERRPGAGHGSMWG